MKKYFITETVSPILVTAIHDGHLMRDQVRKLSALSAEERMREEDPYTLYMAEVSENRAGTTISRFEADLNRTREKAIYRKPEDAWGLKIWTSDPSQEMVEESLKYYDSFYSELRNHLEKMIQSYGKIVVLDIHTYNHRRNGPFAEEAEASGNPEINIGSKNNSPLFRDLLQNYIRFLSRQEINGKHPEVGENVKFDGGGMSVWIFKNFPNDVCTISLEFKKTFMDEWTGVADVNHLNSIRDAVKNSIDFLEYELKVLDKVEVS